MKLKLNTEKEKTDKLKKNAYFYNLWAFGCCCWFINEIEEGLRTENLVNCLKLQ